MDFTRAETLADEVKVTPIRPAFDISSIHPAEAFQTGGGTFEPSALDPMRQSMVAHDALGAPPRDNSQAGTIPSVVHVNAPDPMYAAAVGTGYMSGVYRAVAFQFPKHIALALEHNPHQTVYDTVDSYCDDNRVEADEWVSEDQRLKALASGDMWECMWYPDTPVGSCRKFAADIDVLLAYLAEVR